jgi:hypothetical protein
MMISMSLFGMVVAGFITLQIFGLKQSQLVESKLGASDQSRKMLERMGLEVRAAKFWWIGSVSGSSFTQIADNQPQKGGALRLFLTESTNNTFVTYYFVTNSSTAERTLSRNQVGTNGVSLGATTVARQLTNNMTFQVESYYGKLETDRDNWKACIRVILEFAQFQYPLTQVGPGYLYDYYKLEFKIAPHCPSKQ